MLRFLTSHIVICDEVAVDLGIGEILEVTVRCCDPKGFASADSSNEIAERDHWHSCVVAKVCDVACLLLDSAITVVWSQVCDVTVVQDELGAVLGHKCQVQCWNVGRQGGSLHLGKCMGLAGSLNDSCREDEKSSDDPFGPIGMFHHAVDISSLFS